MKASPRRQGRLPWLLCGAAAIGSATFIKRRKRGAGIYRGSALWWLYDHTAQALDRRRGWDKLPRPIGFLVLVGLRNILRRDNLHDTNAEPVVWPPVEPRWDPGFAVGRSPEGSFNDLDQPRMGMQGTRFGRNVPIEETWREPDPGFMTPNPRTVSLELLARGDRPFKPATRVNLLAAAWIQFMVKDWFSHGEGHPDRAWDIPIDEGDPWPQRPFRILETAEDHTRPPNSELPKTYLNTATHWWDGSQIYGSTIDEQRDRRAGRDGKLVIGSDGLLVLPEERKRNPALVPGWWLGLNVMATAFVLEHNAVCDRLKAEYPTMTDEDLFQRARLVVTALMAKIHTTEWTTAIIAHRTSVMGLRSEWWGLEGERISRAFGRIGGGEILSGIPGSPTDHYGVPLTITEEFGIVYRMHPLIPDHYRFRSLATDTEICTKGLGDLTGLAAQAFTREVAMADILYTFGTANPGAIELHNFPNSLVQFHRPDNDRLMDIAAIDLLRARELGVPRYVKFRRLLHMTVPRTFTELTGGDEELAEEISRVYDGDIDRVDLMVGMFAEKRPENFAFSDTAFRIFLLMAARRLNSDRFMTKDFNPTVYTPAGFDWVRGNTMLTVLLRHYPELAPALRGVDNAFKPWKLTGDPAGSAA